MNLAADKPRKGVRRVLLLQALLTLLIAAGFGLARGGPDFLSALYGGTTAMLLTAWLGRGVLRGGGLGSMYANAITRYGAAVVLLGIGLGALKLAPLPLIVAFGLAQFGFVADARRQDEAE